MSMALCKLQLTIPLPRPLVAIERAFGAQFQSLPRDNVRKTPFKSVSTLSYEAAGEQGRRVRQLQQMTTVPEWKSRRLQSA
ncbi:MAG: hypothetical protein ACXWKP_24600 [Bradyrhizobium sp.]